MDTAEQIREDLRRVYGKGKTFDITVTAENDEVVFDLMSKLNETTLAKEKNYMEGLRLDAITIRPYLTERIYLGTVLPAMIQAAADGSIDSRQRSMFLAAAGELAASLTKDMQFSRKTDEEYKEFFRPFLTMLEQKGRIGGHPDFDLAFAQIKDRCRYY